jgi:hypothetical protein
LLYLLRYDPKNGENLYDDLDNYIHHFRGRLHFCVDLEASKEPFNPLKDVDKSVLACPNIFSCLKNYVLQCPRKCNKDIHTERKTPTPAKMKLAGENTCHVNMREQISKKVYVRMLTRPTLAPIMLEKVYRTLIVGSSHFVHRSSVFRD